MGEDPSEREDVVFRALRVCFPGQVVPNLMLSRTTQVEMKAAFLQSKLTTELNPRRCET
jgi:hypothetical protein